MSKLSKLFFLISGGIFIMLISGCAAVDTAVSHHNLDSSTKMSNTIFLDPVSDNQKTVFIRVGNTSGQSGTDFSNLLKQDLQNNGYKVVTSLDKAHYLVQANVIKAGKTTEDGAQSILAGGYGSAISGGVMGLGVGALVGSSSEATIAGGLIGSAVGFAANELVKDQIYGMVTDIQLSERSSKSLYQRSSAMAQQGNSSTTQVISSGATSWIPYRTRVVSTVDQVNLSFSKAMDALKQQTAQSISGLFI